MKSTDWLSLQDATFLYAETEKAPMHIGSVHEFEGVISFPRFLKFVESKLPRIPRYLQRVSIPSYSLERPNWECDPDFDIRRHVRRVVLQHGSDTELRDLAGRVFTPMLDRRYPLWDITLVHGLTNKRSAIIYRLHHCMVDGTAGVGIASLLMDVTPNRPRESSSAHAAVSEMFRRLREFKKGYPTDAALEHLLEGTSGRISALLSVPSTAAEVLLSLSSVQGASSVLSLLNFLPSLLTPAEKLPFNQMCTGPRQVAWADFSLAEVKDVGEITGAKINDVALAVLTLALRRYLLAHGVKDLEDRLLHIMVPANVRANESTADLGNRVSMLPISVPLGIDDLVLLISDIARRTAVLKSAKVADVLDMVNTVTLSATPAPLQSAIGTLFNLVPLPAFNMVCTNIHGPEGSLYVLGHKMLTYYPYVPIANEMAINCAIASYNGTLHFGLTGDTEAAPDLNRLVELLNRAFADIKHAAKLSGCARTRSGVRRVAPSPRAHKRSKVKKPVASAVTKR